MKDEKFLEDLYEHVILKRYGEHIDTAKVRWTSHGKVDLDAWAHYFESQGKDYVLLYEDFPDGSFLKDGLSHELIKCGDEASIELRFNDGKQLDNITGWFTLYRELQH